MKLSLLSFTVGRGAVIDLREPSLDAVRFRGGRGSIVAAVQPASRPRAGMIPPVVSLQLTLTLFLARQADIGRSGGEISRHLPSRPNLEYLRKEAKDQQRIVLQRVSAV